MDETQYPDYYVKLNRFFPIFPQPYTFYQNNSPENLFNDNLRIGNNSFTNQHLSTVTVRSPKTD